MLGTLRGFLATWPARIFFAILASAFALWGIAGKDPFGSGGEEGISVGGHTIGMADIERTYRQGLAEAARSMGQTDPSAELRRAVAEQTIDRVATQAALQATARDLGIAVPDDALRTAAFAIPAFQDKSGKYDRATMLDVLRTNGLTEASFLDILRDDLAQQQILGAVQAGIRVPDLLARRIYEFEHEARTAEVVDLPFATAAAPAAPTDAQSRRWYENHPDSYSTPEYRRIKAIVLTPETVARDVSISDADLRAAWEQRKSEFVKPDRRSVEVLSALPDEATARRLAAQWAAGADWAAMQLAARQAGGAGAELDSATQAEFPAPELGDAAFAAPVGTVAPPVKGALGWYVLKVTKAVTGVTQTFEEARDPLRARLAAEKAADLLYDRANRIEDLLAGGSKLGDLPGDLGVAAITGTLDQAGDTPQDRPAPIPGPPALRAALIQAAFAAHPGDPAKLTQAPGNAGPNQPKSYYAVEVEAITPPAPRPFDQVAAKVRADWTRDQERRERDQAATSLMTGVNDGGALAALAAKAGLTARTLPPTGRDQPADGVPPQLLPPLFSLKKGEATMVETPTGFVVAVLTDIKTPDPATDPIGYAQLKDVLDRSLNQDVTATFAAAAREAAKPRITGRVLADLTQAGQ
jgi:peptidyl-prolyl cis-trans isomerase D